MADAIPSPVRSPESDISPGTQPLSRAEADYFALNKDGDDRKKGDGVSPAQKSEHTAKGDEKEIDNTGDASATTPGGTASETGSSAPVSRKASISSVTFKHPRNPSLPQGAKKPHGGSRIREASPPHHRFESHVGFDNVPLGEPTEYNPISFTLNERHKGYQWKRRHRTFMVGVDDNSYSDHALQWLLDELVDDGDEIVCVRVIETQFRLSSYAYQQDAKVLMHHIQEKNTTNHAILLTLEYAVGKLHNTFQHLIKIYQPSMLIVGTKGRSLDGMQGFLNRNSFSKYCLQYSPVPVVVVRPTEKREKKKEKRKHDPDRQSYIKMLGGQKHEADSENSSVYELEPNLTKDEEAHRVAVAVGLPASYDPTIRPVDPRSLLRQAQRNSTTNVLSQVPGMTSSEKGSDDEESEFEEDGFEVTSGEQAMKKERLHSMEVGEAAALLSSGIGAEDVDSDDDSQSRESNGKEGSNG